MAATALASPVKLLLEQRGVDRRLVATALQVPVATVADWERNIEGASASQIHDLAVLLDVSTAVVSGGEPIEKSKDFRSDGDAPLYGSLKISIPGHELDYPIDLPNRERVLDHLQDLSVYEAGKEAGWLAFSTLNNKIVYVNLSEASQIELASDDTEATVNYEHPEVYAALEDQWSGTNEIGPVIRGRCEALIDKDETLADSCNETRGPVREALYTRAVGMDGKVSWHFMLGAEDTEGYFGLEMSATGSFLANRFLPVLTEGYHRVRFVNLSRTALLEVPAQRYSRLIDEEGKESEVKEDNPGD